MYTPDHLIPQSKLFSIFTAQNDFRFFIFLNVPMSVFVYSKFRGRNSLRVFIYIIMTVTLG